MTQHSNIFKMFIDNKKILSQFLRRYSSNAHDIDDICQETITRALQAEKDRVIHEPRAFLFGVAKNIARKELEKKSKSLIDFIEDFCDQEYPSNEPSIEDSIDSHDRMMIFWQAVSSLPPQCQKVFVLKKVHGHSHKEIANLLEISVSTVEKHVAMGLKRSSEFMDKQLKNPTDYQNEQQKNQVVSLTKKEGITK